MLFSVTNVDFGVEELSQDACQGRCRNALRIYVAGSTQASSGALSSENALRLG